MAGLLETDDSAERVGGASERHNRRLVPRDERRTRLAGGREGDVFSGGSAARVSLAPHVFPGDALAAA